MKDIYGPASALNSVASRPSDGRYFGDADTWFRDCTTPTSQDGTQVTAAWLNQVTGVLRAVARVNGLKLDGLNPVVAYDQTDTMVISSIEHLIQRGRLNYGVDQGVANALSVTLPLTPAELLDGFMVAVRVIAANTGDAALTLVGLSAVPFPVVKADGSALAAGDLQADGLVTLRYHAASGKFRAAGLLKSDFSVSTSNAVTIAQTLIVNYPSIGPARNLWAKKTAGTYTFKVGIDCPSAVTRIFVRLVGAGGGGAGGSGGATWASGGGGSGGYVEGWLTVTDGQEIPGVVGAGGAGADNTNGATGGTGGSTFFGASMSATGGQGGKGGTGTCAGGNPGAGSGGQVALPGGFGADGNPYNAQVQGGAGAPSAFGGAGRTSTTANGAMNGQAPGAGGGGVYDTRFGTAQIGGSGADGAIFVYY